MQTSADRINPCELVGCDKEADFIIVDTHEGATYEDSAYACKKHLDELMSDKCVITPIK